MDTITLTEALSEVNLINKKIESKRLKIKGTLSRAEHVPDPFESEGGSPKMIQSELQSIEDLSRRLSRIRGAISLANLNNNITVGEETRTIHDWLVWKREVAKGQIEFSAAVSRDLKAQIDKGSTQPQIYKDQQEQTHLVKWLYNIDYSQWCKNHEKLTDKFETLDGKLSLKNAIITVTI